MKQANNIYLQWKRKAQIDYIPLFISHWLSFNAWMQVNFKGTDDRPKLELLKQQSHILYDKFDDLILTQDIFKGNFGELHRALEDARIPYKIWPKDIISFNSCPITWQGQSSTLESVLKKENEHHKIQIGVNLWVEDNTKRLFGAYIEILYQIRCELFHGRLEPRREHERVMKQLYLTLSMIMEHV